MPLRTEKVESPRKNQRDWALSPGSRARTDAGLLKWQFFSPSYNAKAVGKRSCAPTTHTRPLGLAPAQIRAPEDERFERHKFTGGLSKNGAEVVQTLALKNGFSAC